MENINEAPQLEQKIEKLEKQNAELKALVKFYEEQFRLAKHRQYGASSEKSDTAEQLGLFDEADKESDKKADEPTVEQITYSRRKKDGKREEDLSKLPVETVDYIISEEEQVCPECGKNLHEMSQEIRRELKIIPAKVVVVEHVQHIYACRSCEKNNETVPVIKASAPAPLIKGSLASASAVAQIITQKYVNAVPLYRQERDFLRNGVALSRQTMANWLIRCAEDWLTPLYNLMKEELLKQPVLHADETVLQVLQEPNKKAQTNSYMWLYRTSGCSEHAIVLYEYQPTRSSSHPKKFLFNFEGYLHTDGYAGYHSIPNITVVGCWAHMRRKFDEAVKALPENDRPNSVAQIGLGYCNQLFALERDFESLVPENRYEKRLEKSKPVAQAFFEWANTINALPKSALGKALTYALGQKSFLLNVFLDGCLELSNNRAERSIKPFVIGRKNWMFSNSQKGATASAVIYSIIETAKENRLIPFEYVNFLLTVLPSTPLSQLGNLLPWAHIIPAACKVPHI